MSTSIKPFTSSFCFLVCVGSRCESFLRPDADRLRKSFMCHLWMPLPLKPTHPFCRKKRTIKDYDRLIKRMAARWTKEPSFFRWVVSTDHHSCLITFVSWSIQPLIVVEYSPNVQMQKLGEDLAGNYTHWMRSSGKQSLLVTEIPATSTLFWFYIFPHKKY